MVIADQYSIITMGSNQPFHIPNPHQPGLNSQGTGRPYHQSYHTSLPIPPCTIASEYQSGGQHIELSIRLALAEKDLELAQAEKQKNDLVIQWLLASKTNQHTGETDCANLREEIKNLKAKNARSEKDLHKLTESLRKALTTISKLTAVKAASDDIFPTATSIRSNIDSEDSPVKPENLIDLSAPAGMEIEQAICLEEENTTLMDSYEDLSNSLGSVPQRQLEPFSEFVEKTTYIRHFTNDSSDDFSAPSGPVSASTSFYSISNDESSPASDPVSASISFGSASDDVSPAVVAWQKAVRSGDIRNADSVPEKWTVDDAVNAMKALHYPQDMVNMVKAAGARQDTTPHPASSHVASKAFQPLHKNYGNFSPYPRKAVYRCNAEFINGHVRDQPGLEFEVRFVPEPGRQDIYRTVVISNIPTGIDLGTLLKEVRGGAVFEANLLDTVSITGTLSALVVFMHERSAMGFQDYTKEHPVLLGGSTLQVNMVTTPTFPIPGRLCKAIKDHQHTRCLEVHNFPRSIPPKRVRNDLRFSEVMDGDRILHMSLCTDGTLELQFSSVHWADHAFEVFSSSKIYRENTACFVSDPCAQPLGKPCEAVAENVDPVGLEMSTTANQEPTIEEGESL